MVLLKTSEMKRLRQPRSSADFLQTRQPTNNVFIEAFNSRFRHECLNQYWFLGMAEAKATIETWRQEYNRCRPHGALGDLTPLEFLQQAHETSK